MSFDPHIDDIVSRRYIITEMGAEPVDQLSEKEISYWIPIEEVESIKEFLYLVSRFWGKFLPDSLYGKGRLWEAYLKTEPIRQRLGI